MVIVAFFLWKAPITARQTVPRLKAFAYAVSSLWGFHMIYGGAGHRKRISHITLYLIINNLQLHSFYEVSKIMLQFFFC